MSEAALEAGLLEAHAARDLPRLVRGYARAGDGAERAGEIDRACFFLTHAWIFALEAGDPLARDLRARLIAHGREVEQ